MEELHKSTSQILEFHCYQKNITYSQGMIEVLLPFLLMKDEHGFGLGEVYGYYRRFSELYMGNVMHSMFNGQSSSLPYLKCALSLLDLMLKYHDPLMHI